MFSVSFANSPIILTYEEFSTSYKTQCRFQEKDHFGEMFPLVADWILIFFPKERPSGLKIYFIDKIWEPVWQILVGCPSGQLIDTSFCQIQLIKVPLGALSDE